MSLFLDIAAQYEMTDTVFAGAEKQALEAGDEAAFDAAGRARRSNDQAYFLYLFTRFEAEVNAAVALLLSTRSADTRPWDERRVWQAWSRGGGRDVTFLSKMEVLTDKGRADYANAKRYYDGRNRLAHGEDLDVQFLLPAVAQEMHDAARRWVKI